MAMFSVLLGKSRVTHIISTAINQDEASLLSRVRFPALVNTANKIGVTYFAKSNHGRGGTFV